MQISKDINIKIWTYVDDKKYCDDRCKYYEELEDNFAELFETKCHLFGVDIELIVGMDNPDGTTVKNLRCDECLKLFGVNNAKS
jgi:DNA gyrase inhibitor GyrI